MADIILTAKSGSDWSQNELLALHITIAPETAAQFFGRDLPSVDNLNPDLFLPYDQWHQVEDRTIRNVLRFIGMLSESPCPESVTDMYARDLFQTLNYDSDGRIVLERYPIRLTMHGLRCWANTDVVLMSYDRQVFCVVQEDRPENYNNAMPDALPDAQLVAEAIAAAEQNNLVRHERGLPAKDMIIMAIAMVGMQPVFYKVPVSLELARTVQLGGPYPSETIVKRCRIEAPHIRNSLRYMRDIEYRKYVIQHYLLFRDMVDENSRDIMT